MLVSKLVFGVESAPSVLPTIDGREVLTKDMVMALSESGEHGGGDDDGGVDGVSDNLASILIHWTRGGNQNLPRAALTFPGLLLKKA